MQCPNCKFENIPGQTKCFSCGCILESEEDFDPTPPRASAWKKINSRTTRIFRKVGLRFRFVPSGFIENLCWNELIAVGLSLVPGLPQVLQCRFKHMWWAIALWGFCLIGGLLLLGTDLGAVLIAVCISTHAFLISNSILLKLKFWRQILLNLALTAIIASFYVHVMWHWVFGLSQVGAGVVLPAQNITSNSRTLVRRVGDRNWERGDLVVVPMETHTNHGVNRRHNGMGQIIGLPGETIQLKDNHFFCNGVPLSIIKYPIQQDYNNRELTVTLGPSEYFLNINYNIRFDRQADISILKEACIFNEEQIAGRVIVKLPIWDMD